MLTAKTLKDIVQMILKMSLSKNQKLYTKIHSLYTLQNNLLTKVTQKTILVPKP
jgi:hypothetical protein